MALYGKTAETFGNANLGPRIRFIAQAHDFGKVVAGDIVKYEFAFTNVGDRLLELRGVDPTCGCITVHDWPPKIAPGQTGRVQLELVTTFLEGAVAKTVCVACNDPTQSITLLQLRGTVWKPVELTPRLVVLRPAIGDSAGATGMVRILSHLPGPILFGAPSCDNPAFSVFLQTNDPGREFQLIVKSLAREKQTAVQGTIMLKTSSPVVPQISIPVLTIPQMLTRTSSLPAASTATLPNNVGSADFALPDTY